MQLFGGHVYMNEVLKKKIVCFSANTLAAVSVLISSGCLCDKIKNCSKFSLENVDYLAAKSVFSENFNFHKISDLFSRPKSNIYFSTGNTTNEAPIIPPTETNTPEIQISNINLPDVNNDEDDEKHSENEKTYKIIESEFKSGGIKFENFYVKNSTGQDIDIAHELSLKPDINIKKSNEPQVLIFHTHTSESYMKKDLGFFYESFYPRSLNDNNNVTRVGQAITDKLIENGINTIHDMTYHDTPSYNGSYNRAAETIKKNLEKYSSIQVVIDIHRDSLGSKENGKIKPTFKYQNKKAAQMMVVSGCDPDNSMGFPNWEKNLRFALRIQKYCETMFPGITRPMHFAKVKYNEHITPGSVLIEVGSDVNTLEEAVNTGTMIGESLSKLLNDLQKEG